ncbi:sigma factor [Aneurinibacillus tyrosinisolvens]|uniref:sigma factor n=1 Tax=Aneurinibacillus tyrosinisolvens TaxID=1443435 RepID=UPI00063F4BCB|nr:sigma factor [Aneurinibacillus tyrosinisolvens]
MVDDRLLCCARQGNRDCLRKLLKEIEQHVYTTAFYVLQSQPDAVAASQEALLEIYKSVHKYSGEHGAFALWVQRITGGICLHILSRQRERHPLHDIPPFESIGSHRHYNNK